MSFRQGDRIILNDTSTPCRPPSVMLLITDSRCGRSIPYVGSLGYVPPRYGDSCGPRAIEYNASVTPPCQRVLP